MGFANKELLDILSHWGIDSVVNISPLPGGPVYLVERLGATPLVLKDLGEAAEDQLKNQTFYHQVMQHLHESNIPIAAPIANQAGSTLTRHDTRLYVLLPHIVNEALDETAPEQAWHSRFRNSGREVARLHLALRSFDLESAERPLYRNPLKEEFEYRCLQVRETLTGDELAWFDQYRPDQPAF